MAQPYDKPHLSIDKQIDKLRQNGMLFGQADPAEALRRVGYYRLSGYWHHYREEGVDVTLVPPGIIGDSGAQQPPSHSAMSPEDGDSGTVDEEIQRLSSFVPGTQFDQVLATYEFDRDLRMRIFDAIEMIEVALRFRLGYQLGEFHSFAHRDPHAMTNEFAFSNSPRTGLEFSQWQKSNHAAALREVDEAESRSKEKFVLHYKKKYGGPMPVWMSTEVMTFGTLSRIFAGMESARQDRVATIYGIAGKRPGGDGGTLSDWLNHIRYIRNVCAHHSRIWNKNITVNLPITTNIPELDHISPHRSRTRIYGTLAVLAFLVARIDPSSRWRIEMKTFLQTRLPGLGQELHVLGFPERWESEALWAGDYRSPSVGMDVLLDVLDTVDSHTATEAGAVVAFERNAKDRQKRLRWLRDKGYVLAISLSGAWTYPQFQFETSSDTGMYQQARDINRRLLPNGTSDQKAAKDALLWWIADHTLADGRTVNPASDLTAGTLDSEAVEELLMQRSLPHVREKPIRRSCVGEWLARLVRGV